MKLVPMMITLLLAPGAVLAQDAPPPAEEGPPAAVGELFVSSAKEGLPITLDGEETEWVTPAMIGDLPEGLHTVEIRQECAHFLVDVQVKALQIARVEADPVEGVGALRVTSEPSGAVVRLNGDVLGASPLEVFDVPCGEDHTLSVETDGFLTKDRVIRVPAFNTTDEHLKLEVKSFGVLVIGVSPLDADLYLDGEKVARGPITLEQIPNGPHDLSVVREGFVPLDKSIYVSSEAVNRLDLTLEPGAEPAGWVAPGAESTEPADPADTADSTEPVSTEPAETAEPVDSEPDVASADPAPAASEPAPRAAGAAGPPIGRLALNGAVSAAGLVTVGIAANTYLGAREIYNNEFLIELDDDAANEIFETKIAPQQRTAAVQGVAGGLMLAGSAALWLTTDYTVVVTPRGASLGWRF